MVVVVVNKQAADTDKRVEDCTDTYKEIGGMDLDQAAVDTHNSDEEEDHRNKDMACSYHTDNFPSIKHSIILNYPENIKIECTDRIKISKTISNFKSSQRREVYLITSDDDMTVSGSFREKWRRSKIVCPR